MSSRVLSRLTHGSLVDALLFWLRGFAVAAYTHSRYDIFVALLFTA